MSTKLRTRISSKPAIVITRSATRADKLVYVATANKQIKYKNGRSKIVYIGTTKTGAKRIAQSAASKAEKMLSIHGVSALEFHTVVVRNSVKGLKSWRLLERALILRFREVHSETPKCNVVGKRMKWRHERKYLSYDKLDTILQQLS